jgi:ABC-2 type transport system ATP-binding protein
MADEKKNLAIQTAGLTKIFRDFWGHQRVVAVDNLDLEITAHEVFGLLGPNGSGKSTTIKMLLGLLHTTRGWARVLGQHPGDVKTNARIGYLPEESYLYPFLNARETLDFYGRLFGITRTSRRQRIDSLLEMVGLVSVSRRPIGEYSKGMIRRIGLAQALINDPDLLILDEPTAGLDPIGTRQIKDLIRELGRRGKTVLLCSHLLADVEDVCDRICILYGGKTQKQGSVDEMLSRREFTQILSPALSPDTVAKIENIIINQYPGCQVEVETPRDRLEEVFLRIVSEAQASQIETSGAIIGSGVSDFLTASVSPEDESRAVIEKLVTDRQSQSDLLGLSDESSSTQGPLAMAPLEEEAVRDEVLESLIGSSTTGVASGDGDSADQWKGDDDFTASVEPVDLKDRSSDDLPVDRGVIDNLLGGHRADGHSVPSEDSTDGDSQDDVPPPGR